MPDETATPVETLEPPTAPSAPAELPEGAPVESVAEPAETLDSILERFEAEDSPNKTRFQEWKEEREAHGWTKALESFEPSVQQLQQQQQQITEQVNRGVQIWNTIAGRVNKALEEGTLDGDAMSKLFQSPEAWKALEGLSEESQKAARLKANAEGSWQAAHYLATEVLRYAAQPNLLATFEQRLAAAQAGREDQRAVVKDLAQALMDVGYKRGLAESRKGQVEEKKAQDRTGKGPDTATKRAGAGMGYSTQREAAVLHTQGKITHDEMRVARRTLPPE